jgi:hypothetical protein
MPVFPGTAMSSLPPMESPSLNIVIRSTLDRMPTSDTVGTVITSLTGHLTRLMPLVAAKDWASHGQDKLVGLILDTVRAMLDAAPAPEAETSVRAVYAQELARTCRGLQGLALADLDDDEGTAAP